MATYTAIPDSELQPDAPARSINALQLRDNPIAITEGASGAPKNVAEALVNGAPIVGGATGISWVLEADRSTTSTGYPSVASTSDGRQSRIRVYATGTIRVNMSHRISNAAASSFIRLLKNGVLVQEFSTSSTSAVARNISVAVAFGDRLEFQHRTTNATYTSSMNFTSVAGDDPFWVAGEVGC